MLRGGPQLGEGVGRDLLGGRQEAEDAAAAIVYQHHRQRWPGTCTTEALFLNTVCHLASHGKELSAAYTDAGRYIPIKMQLHRGRASAVSLQRLTRGTQQVEAVDVVQEGHVADDQGGAAAQALRKPRGAGQHAVDAGRAPVGPHWRVAACSQPEYASQTVTNHVSLKTVDWLVTK